MAAFARALPEDDLLFLQRDITQPAEVDWWIQETVQGNLVTIVAWEGPNVLGYATYDRGTVRWTRHVAELRVVVAESARGAGVGRLLLELPMNLPFARVGTHSTASLNSPEKMGTRWNASLPDSWPVGPACLPPARGYDCQQFKIGMRL